MVSVIMGCKRYATVLLLEHQMHLEQEYLAQQNHAFTVFYIRNQWVQPKHNQEVTKITIIISFS